MIFNSTQKLSPSLILKFKTSKSASESSSFSVYNFIILSTLVISSPFFWWMPESFFSKPKHTQSYPICDSTISFSCPHTTLMKPMFLVLPFEHLPTDSSSRTPLGHRRHPSPASAFQTGQWCYSTWSLHLSDQRGLQLWAPFLLFRSGRRGSPGRLTPEQTQKRCWLVFVQIK